jgi:hypothetical protein
MHKKYFGLNKNTTVWSYSHGLPLWVVDLQKCLFFALPIGLIGALFSHFTHYSVFWVTLPVSFLISYIFCGK